LIVTDFPILAELRVDSYSVGLTVDVDKGTSFLGSGEAGGGAGAAALGGGSSSFLLLFHIGKLSNKSIKVGRKWQTGE
jgi:hypothetical protein